MATLKLFIILLFSANAGDGEPDLSPVTTYLADWVEEERVDGVAVKDRLRRTQPAFIETRRRLRDAIAPGTVAPQAAPGDVEITISHQGRERTARLHVPSDRFEGPLPLVVVLHGGGGNATNAERMTRFSALADEEGFLVAYPNGTGALPSVLLTWNSGGLPVYAVENDVDDVGFLRALVDEIAQRAPVDRGRVFATGMSNGGMMVHRLAREAADVFAAIADVSGAMNFTATDSTTPISVMMIHGRADEHVGYDGGRPARAVGRAQDRVDASVAEATAYYVERLGLEPTPGRERCGKVTIETWSAPGDAAGRALVVVSIADEGHTWPGGPVIRRAADVPTAEFDATVEIWRFFRAHPRLPR